MPLSAARSATALPTACAAETLPVPLTVSLIAFSTVEAAASTVSVRRRHKGDLGSMQVTELTELLNDEIQNRSS